jgi:hypothetical protein
MTDPSIPKTGEIHAAGVARMTVASTHCQCEIRTPFPAPATFFSKSSISSHSAPANRLIDKKLKSRLI